LKEKSREEYLVTYKEPSHTQSFTCPWLLLGDSSTASTPPRGSVLLFSDFAKERKKK
jgi:hypothetical protein